MDEPGYVINAPYYELIIPTAHWDSLAAALGKLLAGARTVVEIGAGTGYFTETMLRDLDAEIVAIEPARVMRAALVTRLARIPEAGTRVTVLAEDAAAAEVPGPVDAVVLLNLVMHFAPGERRALWRKWASALRPGGTLVVEAQYPQRAEPVEPAVLPGRTLGRRRYEARTRADVIGPDMVRWVNAYRTWEGDRLVAEEVAEFDCHVVSDERLAAELAEAGLTPVPDAPEGVHAWRL
ncbi:class I SAM-dependent methyltransferase [Spirillospora sp. CA-294931]|uniref:class I SAM-dependent methyltransferase n=1 Tax=Spirillospora sp. CA-294931 TaxID=3240042 RepID=UPI003D9184BA